jgi:hypothetical protein
MSTDVLGQIWLGEHVKSGRKPGEMLLDGTFMSVSGCAPRI